MGYSDSPVLQSIRAIEQNENRELETLFTSEDMYWLTMAMATDIALARLTEPQRQMNQELTDIFIQYLHDGKLSAQHDQVVRADALANLKAINSCSCKTCAFDEDQALSLCGAFTVYWMFSTLLEVEWQQKLEQDDVVNTFLFLDGVIADQEELAYIKEKKESTDALHDDEIVFLRTHWQNAKDFFNRLYLTTDLLDRGLIRIK